MIIKPVLDLFGLESVRTASFLSSCTVLSMSIYSVGKMLISQEGLVDFQSGTPLAIGASAGGITGKIVFTLLNGAGASQSFCLAAVTCGTLAYTMNKSKIRPRQISSPMASAIVGVVLGLLSSFLGIGGGPINLAVLHYFFSMDTKTAAANSLYIILFSQSSALTLMLLTNSVPEFEMGSLLLMVLGGIGGGMVGRGISREISTQKIERLFIILMLLIIGISVYNFF